MVLFWVEVLSRWPRVGVISVVLVVVVEWAVWAGGATDSLGSVGLGRRGDVGRLRGVWDWCEWIWPVPAVGWC